MSAPQQVLLGTTATAAVFIGAATQVGANPIVTLPAGTMPGDYLVAAGTSNNDWQSPSLVGWMIDLNLPSGTHLLVARKFYTSGTTVQFQNTGSGSTLAILVYRGINTSTPTDTTTGSKSGNGGTVTTKSFVTNNPREIIVSTFASNDNNGSWTTTPAGVNVRVNISSIGISDRPLLVCDENQDVAGATAVRTATQTHGNAWDTMAIALRPA